MGSQPFHDLRANALPHGDLDLGRVLLKGPDDGGEPVGGDAGIGGDGHAAGEQAVDLGGQGKNAFLLGQKLLYGGQEAGAVFRQDYALFAPEEEGKAEVFFQGADQLAHAGGSIIQLLGCAGKAAGLGGGEKGFAAGSFHCKPSYLLVLLKET